MVNECQRSIMQMYLFKGIFQTLFADKNYLE
ncbi:MAG: hypothetical protein ACI9XO_002182 [Paraglaciecola sp.]|jgi:hypothetical protein